MKTILTLIHDDPGIESRVHVALDVAHAADCQLICLDLTIPAVPIVADPLYGTMVLEPEVRGQAQVAARARIKQSGIPFRWVEKQGNLNREIADLATLADLVVLTAPKDLVFPDMRSAIGTLLVKSQSRVISVPAAASGIDAKGEVLLLWDGSDAAHNAMVAAVPLLRIATNVTIFEVDDGSLGTSALHASEYLTRVHVRNRVKTIAAMGKNAQYRILREIESSRPAYVAMGGYGHSRLVEGLFGGVTEELLSKSPVPVFLKN